MYGLSTYGQRPYGSTSSAGETGNKLYVSGIDRSGMLTQETLVIRESINSRSTMSFKLVDSAGSYLPAAGEAVEWKRDGVLIFAGSIEDVSWTAVGGFSTGRSLTCNCVNKARVLDRRLIAKAYTGFSTDNIVRDIITNYLAGDGISAGVIDTGPTVTKAVFNYVSAAKAMNDLCDLTGYTWYVDQFGQLHVRNRSTVRAPWDITAISAPVFNVKSQDSRQNYANVQWLRAGQDTTDVRVESLKGDGTRQTFTLKYPVATVPTVTVNSVAKTVGIRGVDAGKDFYWNKSDKEITQDDAATPLTSSDTIVVTYQGFYPLIVKVQDDADVLDRILVESGSGVYERIEADESIEDRDLAQDKAAGLLRKYSQIQRTVNYDANLFGIRAGQLQTISRSEENLSGDFLVADVTIKWSVDRNDYIISVRALSGEQLGGWQIFFRKLFQSGNKFTIRENEVILSAANKIDNITLTDSMSTATAVSDGSDDPFTTAWVSDPTQSVGHQFRVGKARLGRDYFS